MLALAVTGLALAGCRQEVRFTKIPTPVPADADGPTKLTSIFVGVPVDVAALEDHVNAALPERIGRVVDWPRNAACYEKRGQRYCDSARTYVTLTRAGKVEILTAGERIQIRIPLAYQMDAYGIKQARGVDESRSGTLRVSADLDVLLGDDLQPQVQLSEELRWSEPVLTVMNGKMDVASLANGRIKRFLRQAPDTLANVLAATPIKQTTKDAWDLLHSPIPLRGESKIWLTGTPELVGNGGFTNIDGALMYRVAIGARLKLSEGASPMPAMIKPLPRRRRKVELAAFTSVRTPVDIGYGQIKSSLKTAWPAPFDVAAVENSPAMRIAVKESDLYASGNLLAVALQLDVETPNRVFDLTGKAYITAVPAVDMKSRSVQLNKIQLAPVNAIPGIGAGTGQRFRLTAAPFESGFRTAANIPVGKQLDAALARANGLFDQDAGRGFWLRGRFSRLAVARVWPGRDSLRLDVDVSGEVLLTLGARTARAKPRGPATKTR